MFENPTLFFFFAKLKKTFSSSSEIMLLVQLNYVVACCNLPFVG